MIFGEVLYPFCDHPIYIYYLFLRLFIMAEFSENEAPKTFDWMPEGCVPLAGESMCIIILTNINMISQLPIRLTNNRWRVRRYYHGNWTN